MRVVSSSAICALILITAGGTGLPAYSQDDASSADAGQFYREKVYPILKENCFKCHGGEDKLKGNFRITSREGLLLGGDLGSAIDEDNPAESLILQTISYQMEDYEMPPKSKLADDQIAILTQWVNEHEAAYDPELEIQGSAAEKRRGFSVSDEDRQWWSYQPIQHRELPDVSDPEWGKNGIDAFIRHGLDEAELEPNPAAEPAPLCRRVFYDLIGLPPALSEVNDFEAAWEKNPETAWKTLIEDLLSRPQYGEKWARHWLDIVRYAESNGFERDNSKPEIWRYRDYVIKAFNEDKPYDQFIIEQIAGDEIAEPTRDSLTATGFHRLMQWDDEPADRKQHVYDVLADNVLVTSEAFLGMTMGCARCHDHKADPVSQKDYYSFMAFYHGISPYQTPGTIRPWAEPEELTRFESERKERVKAKQGEIAALETEMTGYLRQIGRFESEGESPSEVTTYIDDARGSPAVWNYITSAPAPGWKEVAAKAFKNWIKGQGGFGTRNTPNSNVTTEWNSEQIWMRTSFGAKEIPETLVLEIYHDEDAEVYLNGVEIFRARGHVTDYQVIELGQEALDAFQTGNNVLAAHCKQTKGGQFIDMALRTGAQKPGSLPVALKRGGKKLETQLEKNFGRDIVKEWQEAKDQLGQIQREMPGVPLNVVKESGPDPLPLQVHLRGSAHAPGDEVVPAFPAVLSGTNDPKPAQVTPVKQGIGPDSSGRRLALAKWIASPENPLTARVIMNRLWQHHFGRGIAPSTNDLGKLGEAPTHPELLEWLAAELIDRGWSLKAMHRLILQSKTYRMSSAPNADALATDPGNDHFWRFNMRRLTAEELRDSILAVSGNLNLETGGEWVFPPLPPEVLATASRPGKGWPISKRKDDHFRRSVYIHVKRSLRHQMLADFDQADTDSPCAVRFATTVPTQALTMLNSGFVNEQAAILAETLRHHSTQPEEQVREGLSLAFQREPTADEVRQCVNFMENIRSASGLDEKAALERFALLALNLNEFVYLD